MSSVDVSDGTSEDKAILGSPVKKTIIKSQSLLGSPENERSKTRKKKSVQIKQNKNGILLNHLNTFQEILQKYLRNPKLDNDKNSEYNNENKNSFKISKHKASKLVENPEFLEKLSNLKDDILKFKSFKEIDLNLSTIELSLNQKQDSTYLAVKEQIEINSDKRVEIYKRFFEICSLSLLSVIKKVSNKEKRKESNINDISKNLQLEGILEETRQKNNELLPKVRTNVGRNELDPLTLQVSNKNLVFKSIDFSISNSKPEIITPQESDTKNNNISEIHSKKINNSINTDKNIFEIIGSKANPAISKQTEQGVNQNQRKFSNIKDSALIQSLRKFKTGSIRVPENFVHKKINNELSSITNPTNNELTSITKPTNLSSNENTNNSNHITNNVNINKEDNSNPITSSLNLINEYTKNSKNKSTKIKNFQLKSFEKSDEKEESKGLDNHVETPKFVQTDKISSNHKSLIMKDNEPIKVKSCFNPKLNGNGNKNISFESNKEENQNSDCTLENKNILQNELEISTSINIHFSKIANHILPLDLTKVQKLQDENSTRRNLNKRQNSALISARLYNKKSEKFLKRDKGPSFEVAKKEYFIENFNQEEIAFDSKKDEISLKHKIFSSGTKSGVKQRDDNELVKDSVRTVVEYEANNNQLFSPITTLKPDPFYQQNQLSVSVNTNLLPTNTREYLDPQKTTHFSNARDNLINKKGTYAFRTEFEKRKNNYDSDEFYEKSNKLERKGVMCECKII